MFTLPEGCTKVAKEEVANILPNCGSKTSSLFFPGDVIKINEDVYTKIFKADGSDKEIPVAYIHCEVNAIEQVVSFSSFRRFPKDVDAFIKKAPFHRNLFNGSDYDRYLFLKGKTIVVDSIYEGEAIDWRLSDVDAKNYVFKTSKFPIFKERQ